MSAYINCPRCGDPYLDVDTLTCECGYSEGQESESALAAIDDDALANASIEMWASNDDTTQIAVETIRHYRAALRERINGGVTV